MFHVEFRRGRFRSSRVFNLTEIELVERVVRPWQGQASIEVAGQEWPLAEADITILRGPELDASKLAMGRGWSEASRTARDVSGDWLRPPDRADRRAVVVLHDGGDDGACTTLFGLLGELGLAPLDGVPLIERAAEAGLGPDQLVTQAFQLGQALVVLIGAPPGGPDRDVVLVGLGIAMVREPDRTVAVTDGPGVLPRGLEGWVMKTPAQAELARRLAAAGCAVRPEPAPGPTA